MNFDRAANNCIAEVERFERYCASPREKVMSGMKLFEELGTITRSHILADHEGETLAVSDDLKPISQTASPAPTRAPAAVPPPAAQATAVTAKAEYQAALSDTNLVEALIAFHQDRLPPRKSSAPAPKPAPIVPKTYSATELEKSRVENPRSSFRPVQATQIQNVVAKSTSRVRGLIPRTAILHTKRD